MTAKTQDAAGETGEVGTFVPMFDPPPRTGSRQCRECARARRRAFERQQREKKRATLSGSKHE